MHQRIAGISGVFAMLLLAACSSVGTGADNAGQSGDAGRKLPEPIPTCCINPMVPDVPDALDDPASILARRSIYFDLDGYRIKDEFKAILQAHARYLVQHPGRQIRLAGNTDERGSREYNLALGQSRAEAVRRILEIYGVPNARMESISFGKEMPKASGHDEDSWAENRRVDLIYLP